MALPPSHHAAKLAFATLICGAIATSPGFPPSLKPGCLKDDGQPNLFCPGDDGYGCYKIPSLHRTGNGTLLAMIEARKFSCDDAGWVDLRLKRSFDEGKTWGPSILVHSDSTETAWTTVGDASMVEDSTTGVIWLIHTRNNSRLFVSSSRDQGASWSEPVDITAQGKLGYPTQTWVGTGHAGGIQLRNGRLFVAAYSSTSYSLYSDDHGASWHVGGAVTGKYAGGHENQAAEMEDGTLIMTMRQACSFPLHWGCGRIQAYSSDAGNTWENMTEVRQLPEPIAGCEGSIVYHPGTKKLYFSHPNPVLKLFRTNLNIWSSSDQGKTWGHHSTIWPKGAGYSALTVMGNGTAAKLGLLYDRNDHTMVIFEAQSVSFTLIDPQAIGADLVLV